MCRKALAVWWAAVCLCLCVFTASAAARARGMTRLDYTVVRNGSGPRGLPHVSTLKRVEYLAPDGRMRTETIDPQTGRVTSITIENPSQDTVVYLHPDSMTGEEVVGMVSRVKSGLPVLGTHAPQAAQKTDLGTVVIDGITCHRYLDTVAGAASIDFSECRDPVSGQTFMGSMTGRYGSTIGMKPASPSSAAAPAAEWKEALVKVTRDVPLDDSLFEIPPGYRITQK